ncbi:hypothetical protein CSAL01_12275 [Colletotrichum salicis]|uniref:Short-chain dehydrogenase/reductase n=1 Tax=Colletotrichum salicis TaxID=1209931 RepID=A0A135VA49_9PEZI|nr:hypothetical protein CSAL01_12275 [Colletotrichum salicis]
MVSILLVNQSNALIASLPKGLVAVFIGATSGIGNSTLQHLVQHAQSPHIYTIARPQTVASHETFFASLRAATNPDASYTIHPADHALVSDIDTAMDTILQNETKVDILFLSAGFIAVGLGAVGRKGGTGRRRRINTIDIDLRLNRTVAPADVCIPTIAFEGRQDTIEGLDPSMSTRYYTRLRAIQKLLPLLNNAPRPRIVLVLAAGLEGPMVDEDDLNLRKPGNWGFWHASVQATTMGTLALEVLARENPAVSIVHSMPGMVATPGSERARRFGAGERVDDEEVLGDMRQRGLDEKVWKFTQELFDDCLERK